MNRVGLPTLPQVQPAGGAKAPYRNVTRENRARGRRERDDSV